MVALTLLGLVFAAVFGELRFAARAWDASDAKLERDSELLSVHSFLRQRFEQIYVRPVPRRADPQDNPAGFEGSPRSVTFLATMPANVSDGGFYQITLSAVSGEDGEDLFVSWRPFDEGRASSTPDGPNNSRVLLRSIRELHFSYFGASSESVSPQWWDAWPARDTVPWLIRVEIVFAEDDRRHWPDLVVAPAAADAMARLP